MVADVVGGNAMSRDRPFRAECSDAPCELPQVLSAAVMQPRYRAQGLYARHMYHDATDRKGAHRRSIAIASTCRGVGMSLKPYAICVPLRTPRSPVGKMSSRPS